MVPARGADAVFTGADLVVDTLVRLGAEKVFNIVGLGMLGLGRAFLNRRNEIGYVGHLNETNLSLMAQGYARQTGKPTFCIVYHSSGTALAMMSLTTAWADNVPMVLVSTTGARMTSGRDQYAATPRSLTEMSTQYSKWTYDITTPERIPEILARAWEIASTPPMGPVHISIPSDLYDVELSGPLPREDFSRLQCYSDPCAEEAGLAAAAALLRDAQRPVLLCGSEVGRLRTVEEMVALAEALGAPVISEQDPSFLGFPTSHPQYVGTPAANKALLQEADAALAIGYEFTEKGDFGEKPILPSSARLVTLSADPMLLAKQLWPDLALLGHPGPSLRRLAELLEAQPVAADAKARHLGRCAAQREIRAAAVAEAEAMPGDQSPLPQKKLLREVYGRCGKDWIVIQAGSTLGWHVDTMYEFDDPLNFHAVSGKASAQGWGAPAAMGIQMGAPDRRVVALLGDGNLMFSATCIWGAAQHDLPVVFIVNNNQGWLCVPDGMDAVYGTSTESAARDAMAWTWGGAPIDYTGFARSLGLEAERVTTADELGASLEKAKASNRPWLIEVIGE
ncbi:thiamine pyrophosphate TPP-binding domain-containing protein [Celeribacter indicus]|uniref:Thiamine pyrophosphate TPP-binding domain-containing protein n=2 Tax=Celeribacter indicus TaxID=1208324 RepID=A0A0B5E817_9RHOB|nr:thiamine pyrophosphate TPP-binding domain-containing protein [Celeribacter indicus]